MTTLLDTSSFTTGKLTLQPGSGYVVGSSNIAILTIAGGLKTRYRAGRAIDDIVIRFLRVRPPKASGASVDGIRRPEVMR